MKRYVRKRYILIAGLFVLISTFSFTYIQDRDFKLVKSLDIFYSLFRELNTFYVDEADPEELIETGIDAMLNSLDPYTTYIPESELDEFNFMTTGNYGGIGALIRQSDGYAIIAQPYEGSPSAIAGLRAGDFIISVDGYNTKGKDLQNVSERLKGIPGTDLTVIVRRPGEEKTKKFKITREKIHIDNVPYYGELPGKNGYIRLSHFTMGAAQEVKDAFLELKEENEIEKLILDLRNNPGGLLMEAVRTCNLFVDKDQLIVSTRGKISRWDQEYFTSNEVVDKKIPIVVLVNSGSASASEIVAGALQDIDRAVIMGERTFGKGLVQTTRSLKYNTQLKVTTAKYYIPSGRCIQALDYVNRNEDGSVGNIPDSLISEFKTKGGRTVFDGGGIRPDIKNNNDILSQVTLNLYTHNLIFDYATQYVINHPEDPDPDTFIIDDEEYFKFKDFVNRKQFTYETASEQKLNELIEIARKEKYYKNAEAEFSALKSKLQHNNDKDLDMFREEISELLSEEIISRYYFQKGRIEYSLQYDKHVDKACEILDDENSYVSILKPGNNS